MRTTNLRFVVVALATLALFSRPFHASAANVPAELLSARVNAAYPALEKLYRQLHAQPELSFQEARTAARLAEEARALGLQVTTGIGGHGVVAVLRNGDGPTVLVRTDMDALPVQEQTGLPYASAARGTNDAGADVPVMHACGHDVHMTAWVGAATVLSALKDHWRGTLVFIAQPAEERGAGAKAMLKAGLFTRFPRPDFCLALHVNADLPAGTVATVEGFAMANVDSVDVLIRGVGGHGAWPHRTKDPIVLAAQTVLALQTIVSRERDPLEPAVVTVGSIHGGTKHNIIPDEVRLQLTVRSFSDDVRARTLESIRRLVRGQALAAGIPEDRLPSVTLEEDFGPATYNDPALTRRLAAAFKATLGETNVVTWKPTMGAEDFAFYGRTEPKVPICMFWVGAVEPERVAESARTGAALPSLHSPLFRPAAEPAIKTGVRAMTTAVLALAGKD
jgi:hippurate hydrolase